MLSKLFKKSEFSVDERLDLIENSLLQISNYLYKQENEADRKNRKVLERLDFLIKEASVPGSWKKDIDTMIWDLVKEGIGSYPKIRLYIASLFKDKTGVDLYKEINNLREEYLRRHGRMSESTKKGINVTKVLESDTALLQVYWNIVKSEHDKHAKGN